MSNLEIFFDSINVQLVCKFRKCDDWYAMGEGVEVVDVNVLRGVYGNGKDPLDALDNYAKAIAGKRIAVGTCAETRREYNVPKWVGTL